MPALNLDLNFFDHPKTKRLARILGRGSEVVPLRLWVFTARYFAADGKLTGISADELEQECHWWGDKGKMVAALVDCKWIHGRPGSFEVHDWLEYQGHIIAFSERGKLMNQIRWAKERGKNDAIGSPTGNPARSPIGSPIGSPPTERTKPNERNRTEPTKPTDLTNSNRASLFAEPTPEAVRLVQLLSLCKEVLGEEEMKRWHKRWLDRAQAQPEKLSRVLAEVKGAAREGRIKTTPAQYAEQIWKEFV